MVLPKDPLRDLISRGECSFEAFDFRLRSGLRCVRRGRNINHECSHYYFVDVQSIVFSPLNLGIVKRSKERAGRKLCVKPALRFTAVRSTADRQKVRRMYSPWWRPSHSVRFGEIPPASYLVPLIGGVLDVLSYRAVPPI